MQDPHDGNELFLLIMINSAASYTARRKAIRSTWMKYSSAEGPLPETQRQRFKTVFVVGEDEATDVSEESEMYQDIVKVPVQESYSAFIAKILAFLKIAVERHQFSYYFHADDDSFVRVDLLLQALETKPRQRFYYGSMWNLPNQTERVTKPIRNPENKSFMPFEQYPLKEYPPFACGCGFALSRDLCEYLANNAHLFRDIRLDVGIGVYLFPLDIKIDNEPLILPYRPLPLFNPKTIVQHYLKPEEFRGFWQKATNQIVASEEDQKSDESIHQVYDSLVKMGLLRR